MSWLMVALLGLAVAAVLGAEWPRLAQRLGLDARSRRGPVARSRRSVTTRRLRPRRGPDLRVVRSEPDESDDFVASVERDIANLPTIEERDRR